VGEHADRETDEYQPGIGVEYSRGSATIAKWCISADKKNGAASGHGQRRFPA
jgi:hypothetical protein